MSTSAKCNRVSTSLVLLIATACLTGPAAALVSSCPAPTVLSAQAPVWGSFERPFAASAPWNSRPVGASLGTATIPTSLYYPAVATGAYSSAAFMATAADGPMTIVGLTTAGVWDPDSEIRCLSITIPRWPAGVMPASGTDGHAEVVDTVTGVVHSFWKLKQVSGVWQAAQYAWTPLAGRGMGNASHYFQGARAAGVSTLGGLIRKHEVSDGDTMYRHALAMSLTYNGLSANPTYRFPATSADGNAATTNTGAIPMGSLMLLPAGFDAQALRTPELRKVAETLKAYGAYVVDRNYGTPFVIYVENGADFKLHKDGWNSIAASELEKLRMALRPLATASSWVDGNGLSFDPAAPQNLLSMRGYWYKTKGAQAGVFDTWRQAVVFPATSVPIEQVNAGGRAYSGVTWAKPTVGAAYRVTAIATNGARFRMTIKDKVTGAMVFDSGDLSNGQSVDFVWSAQTFTITTLAKSGVSGVKSTVRAELLPVPVVSQTAVQGCV